MIVTTTETAGSVPVSGTALHDRLTDAGSIWLEAARVDVEHHSAAITQHYPAVSRRCGRAPLRDGDLLGLRYGTVDDAARGVLLGALAGPECVDLLDDLYRHGDAGEKRGVLRGLHRLDGPDDPRGTGIGSTLLTLVEDALRTNDVRLVAAALQPYGARYLGVEAYRHAVVKCVFMGVPLHVIANLAERQDAELARMLVDLAHERSAAGRDIPADIPAVVAAFPECLHRADLPADLLNALQPAIPLYKE
ncbi:EboA domain-containing protein [Cryobacterium sp. Hh11]|uniref:EboA domain-containing protein n=1 Tax=Cryobacterium sp. Hh11 TaxID=2555868 RepID=UPI0015815AA8|nr:EboA domain-containing protein [Cryobacterium sp. Hh11]